MSLETQLQALAQAIGTDVKAVMESLPNANQKYVHVGPTAPVSPSVNDLWVDTSG
jgi:hypothetical protein